MSSDTFSHNHLWKNEKKNQKENKQTGSLQVWCHWPKAIKRLNLTTDFSSKYDNYKMF